MELFLFLLSLILRLPSILRGDFAFTYDTGRDLLAVRDILAGHVSLIGPTTGLIGVFYGPWWRWLLSPFSLVFKGNPVALTAMVATIGALTAPIAYVVGKRLVNNAFGFILGLLFAVSPAIIKATNQLWNPDMLISLTTATVLLIGNFSKFSKRHGILLGFLLGLLIEFEMIYGILFIIGFIVCVLLWQKIRFSFLKIRNLVLGFILAELPRILFELRHGFVEVKTLLGELGSSAVTFHPKRSYLIYESISSVLPSTPRIQTILMFAIAFVLIIHWKALNVTPNLKRLILFSLMVTGVFWIGLFFYPKDFWNYYILGLPALYSVIVAGVWVIILNKNATLGKIALVIYLFFLVDVSHLYLTFVHPYFVGDAAVYRNQKEVMDYIDKQRTTSFKYIAYNPAQHDYNWQYLFWWYKYSGKLAGYTESNPAVMYVILEPDDSYPDRLKDWLKVRERDGVVLREVTFPSGIIVQTRRLRWN